MEEQSAVLLHKFGQDAANAVSVGKIPVPSLKAGEALVKLILRPVNPADMLGIQGVYPGFSPKSWPAVPGLEGVGKVVKSSEKFKEGQRVVAGVWDSQIGNGTWQEYVAISEDKLEAVPDNISDQQAAAFWVNPVTAYGLIKILDVPEGKWLLQSAAGSAVGRQIIEIAKHYKIKTFNIVRRSSQKQELLDLGADVVLATDAEDDIKAAVDRATGGEGAYGAVDCVCGELTGKLLSSLRRKGKLLVYGVLSGIQFTASAPDLIFRENVLAGFWLGPWFRSHSKEGQEEIVKELFKLIGEKVISPYVGAVYPLHEARDAITEAIKPARGGKVFLGL